MEGSRRQEEIRKIHNTHKFFYEMLGGGIVLAVSVLIGAAHFGGENPDYQMNLFTEGMGILATVFIINRWYVLRERERHTRELKERLVLQAGSEVSQVAVRAVEQLRQNKWIFGPDSVLQGALLQDANLKNSNLWGANLKGTSLDGAILTGARLVNANLQESSLERALLHKTFVQEADLRGSRMDFATVRQCSLDRANLHKVSAMAADMQESSFCDTDLRQSELIGADLRGANFSSAKLQDVESQQCSTSRDKLDKCSIAKYKTEHG